ncbi:MAG: TonB-dependent receptor, partial [Candidatus Kapabacteria bacterium]|nr:TonB-dependent receptor [Candidatus Kapabacteria bacterium]
MNKSIIIFLLLTVLCFVPLNLISRSFTVYESDAKKTIKSATVYVSSIGKSAKYKKMLTTDRFGKFTVEHKLPVQIAISHIGFFTLIDTLYEKSNSSLYLKRKAIVTDQVVITGQFRPTTAQKSVYSINIVSKERIQAQAASTLKDILTNEMNISIGEDGILGSNLSINGISGQNIKIMIDGIPVIGRLDGNIDISQINLNNAERIEVVEGPMSSIYGSDALGGVINIITKESADDVFEGSLNSYVETVGKYNFDGNASYAFGKNKISASLGRNFFGGYSVVDTTRQKQWKPKEQYFGDLSYSRNFADYKFRYNLRYFDEFILNRGLPRLPYGETAFDDHYRTNRINNSMFLNGKIGDKQFIDVTASYSYYNRKKNKFSKDLVTLEEKLTSDPADQDTSVFTTFMTRGTYSHDDVTDWLKFQAGFDINLDYAASEKIAEDAESMQDFAFFTSLGLSIGDDFIFQPSLRFISNSQYEAPLIPSFNFKYNLTDHITMRASYARGFRAPSLKELYFLFVDVNHNIQGNNTLEAETSHSYNLGATVNFQNDDYVFRIEPKAFYNNITNLISLALVKEGLYSYVNIGDYKTLGVNLSLKYFRTNLSMTLGGSFIG